MMVEVSQRAYGMGERLKQRRGNMYESKFDIQRSNSNNIS